MILSSALRRRKREVRGTMHMRQEVMLGAVRSTAKLHYCLGTAFPLYCIPRYILLTQHRNTYSAPLWRLLTLVCLRLSAWSVQYAQDMFDGLFQTADTLANQVSAASGRCTRLLQVLYCCFSSSSSTRSATVVCTW